MAALEREETAPSLPSLALERSYGSTAGAFKPIACPTLRNSFLWTIAGVCLVTLCAVVYVLNEEKMHSNSWLRGVVVGIYAAIANAAIVPIFATIGCDGLHLTHILVFPLGLIVAILLVRYTHMSLPALMMVTVFLSFCSSIFAWTFTSPQSRKLACITTVSVVSTGIAPLFGLVIVQCITHTAMGFQRSHQVFGGLSEVTAGLSLSIVCFLTQLLACCFSSACFQHLYYHPKKAWLERASCLEPGRCLQHSEVDDKCPFVGDVENAFGALLGIAAVFCREGKLACLFWQMARFKGSKCWIYTVISSMMLSIAMRVGWWHRMLGCLLSRFCSREFSKISAIQVSFARAQFGVGYMSIAIALCPGFLRAVHNDRMEKLLFMDLNTSMPLMLASVLFAEIVEDIVVWLFDRKGLIRFPLGRYEADNPMGDVEFREIDKWGYAIMFIAGSMHILDVYALFLGTNFALGLCGTFDPSVWNHLIFTHGCDTK